MSKKRFALLIAVALCVGASAGAYKPQCKDSSGRLIVCSGTLDNTQAPTAPAMSGANITANTVPAGAIVPGTVDNTEFGYLDGLTGNVQSKLDSLTADLALASIGLTQPAAGLTVTSSVALGAAATFALANDLAALEGLGSTGLAARTGTDTWAQRSIAAGTGLSVSNGNGVSGNPTVSAGTELAGLSALATTGFVQRTGAGTYSTTSAIDLNTNTTGVTPTAKGGTNLSSFTAGSLFYASDTTTISQLGPCSSTQFVGSNGTTPTCSALPTATTGSASLSVTQYDITTTNTFEDIGLSASLPSAGTYLVSADVRTFCQTSGSPPGYVTCKLYNSTDAADVTNSERFGAVDYTNNGSTDTLPIREIITIAASKTIKVYCKTNSGPTFLNRGAASDANGRSRISYVKLSS